MLTVRVVLKATGSRRRPVKNKARMEKYRAEKTAAVGKK
jgi:hypothetical protein